MQVRLSGQTVKGISAIGKGNIQSAFDQLCAIEFALSFFSYAAYSNHETTHTFFEVALRRGKPLARDLFRLTLSADHPPDGQVQSFKINGFQNETVNPRFRPALHVRCAIIC